jgi:putative thiamine transport system ATP-binding protein
MLELRNVALRQKDTALIKPFSLSVAKGETVTIMGASGSGKSSLLSLIGGDLVDVFSAGGDVLLDNAVLNDMPPERRRVGRLFQDDLLFPHMTVAENLLFAVPAAAQAQRLARVEAALQSVGLAGFGSRPPHTLSGGQRQRVALMRALLAEPKAILLDEPFSKLDQDLRAEMRALVFSHITSRDIPALLVSHDRSDAPDKGRVFRIVNSEVTHA